MNKLNIQSICSVCGKPTLNQIDNSEGGLIDIDYRCNRHIDNNIKATLQTIKKTKNYTYKNILIQDIDLIDYELVHKWNYGIDCRKAGANISILIRKHN
jgi:hypothetical protein